MVGLGVLAANVHRMGLVLRRRKWARLKVEAARARHKSLAAQAHLDDRGVPGGRGT